MQAKLPGLLSRTRGTHARLMTGAAAVSALCAATFTPAQPALAASSVPGSVLAYADAGSGMGTSTLTASLLLSIPNSVPAGTYSGSLTITYLLTGP